MEPIDICYTPIIAPDVPDYNINELHQWMNDYHRSRLEKNYATRVQSVSENTYGNEYPWKKIDVYIHDKGWQSNFNTEFPQLAKYLVDLYGLDLSDIMELTLLPLKDELTGWGFWHTDKDEYGLRVYLDNPNYLENTLHYKRTTEAHNVRQVYQLPVKYNDPCFRDEEILCKVVKPRQAFFLNNIRGIHNIFISQPHTSRIAVVIRTFNHRPDILAKIRKLIVDSAEYYKEYAVLF